jgi:hypothetical protein
MGPVYVNFGKPIMAAPMKKTSNLSVNTTRSSPRLGLAARLIVLGTAACAASLISGCGYATWPPVEERFAKSGQINFEPSVIVVGEALSWVTLRHPPVRDAVRGVVYDAAFAINFPEGTSWESAQRVVRRVGRGAEVAGPDNRNLYTYSITRAIVRGTTAEVDVVRPVPDLGRDADGNPRLQGITLRLVGGTKPWRVLNHRTYPVGIVDVPVRYEMTQPEDPYKQFLLPASGTVSEQEPAMDAPVDAPVELIDEPASLPPANLSPRGGQPL